ncbi:MAG: methyltransferase domain-containing protein [Polyangiales bacterium]
MTATCVLCGATCPRRFTVKGYPVHRCARCDLEFVHPTPSPEDIAAVYASDYFEGGAYDDYFAAERDLAERKARARLDMLASLGVTQGTSVDLGCAAGYFVDAALERGFDAYGVEPSARARAYCPASVESRVVERFDDPALPARFELVTLWDVLEHLPTPSTRCARSANASPRRAGSPWWSPRSGT